MNSQTKLSNLGSDRMPIMLLPRYFKTVGILVVALPVAVVMLAKILDIEIIDIEKTLLKYMLINLMIVGLVLIALSREKIEDHFTNSIRVSSLIFSFFWAIAYVILKPLNDLVLKNENLDYNAQGLVLSMLLVYMFLFLVQKKARKTVRE